MVGRAKGPEIMRRIKDTLRSARNRTPAAVRRWLYRRRSIAATEPLSRNFGWERGTPVDRLYIQDYLKANAGLIRGRVLEVGDDSYSRQFGGDRISRQDVLHVDANAPGATITGDLCDPSVLPDGAFDCIVFTQTLQMLFDVQQGIRQLYRSLAPGGTLLLTTPGISPTDPHEWNDCWYWSLNYASVKRLLDEGFGAGNHAIETFGNVYAATALLHGAVAEEIDISAMAPVDPVYPVILAARATKPSAPAV